MYVLRPPRKEPLLDPPVEQNIHERPTRIVHARSRRDVVGANEDQRPVDLAEEVAFGPLPQAPRYDR